MAREQQGLHGLVGSEVFFVYIPRTFDYPKDCAAELVSVDDGFLEVEDLVLEIDCATENSNRKYRPHRFINKDRIIEITSLENMPAIREKYVSYMAWKKEQEKENAGEQ